MTSATLEIDGTPEEVTIFEMKVTPSMKNAVYVVHIVFDSNGDYVSMVSKCDCPNGWLFCSHSLAIILVFYLIQRQAEWTFDEVIDFMPEPIKSLQNLPLAASLVFDELKVSAPGGKKGKKRKRDEKNCFKYAGYQLHADNQGLGFQWVVWLSAGQQASCNHSGNPERL